MDIFSDYLGKMHCLGVEYSKLLQYMNHLEGQRVLLEEEMKKVMSEEEFVAEDINQMFKMLERLEFTVKRKTIVKESEARHRKCRHYDKGYCKNGSRCIYFHPNHVCRIHLEGDGNCKDKKCWETHPKNCKYWIRKEGCTRGETCTYLHRQSTKFRDVKLKDINKNKDIDDAEDIVDEIENGEKDKETINKRMLEE